MNTRDFINDLGVNKKNKSHLDFNFSNLDEDEFVNCFALIFEALKNCNIDNVSFRFSCDYWECDCLDEKNFEVDI